ncbi:MAG TPA: hypothetical protein VJ937_05955 [Salinivirga sp.]|uniref:hypothetical protein n=1 Tax=Salinivirga sp. TaxID=1970192 RepID=UPI002B48267C|nr:hypothetical protein [Salinivirga sp.]HKK59000.1 hypothetical protein [Salinivirga sp.]
MNEKQIRLLGVLIKERQNVATQVQELLTRYGCSIKTRLGMHEATDDRCAPHGLIILELTGASEDMLKLESELNALPGVDAKNITFDL